MADASASGTVGGGSLVTRDGDRRAFSRSLVATIAVVLISSSCTVGARSQTASSNPRARIEDVVAATLRHLEDPTLSAHYTFEGTQTFGAATLSFSGDGAFTGKDDASTTRFAGSDIVYEQVVVGTTRFTKMGDGPWIREPARLTDPFARMRTLDYVGVRSIEGAQLHHLRPTTGFEMLPSDVGQTSSSVTGLDGTFDIFVRDDGRPVVIVVSVQGVFDPGGEGSYTTEVSYSASDADVRIEKPEDPWERFVSEGHGYSIAHPADWKASTTLRRDSFRSRAAQGIVYVEARAVPPDASLDQVVERIAAGVRPAASEGSLLGNEEARLLEYHFERGGLELHALLCLTVRGGRAYAISGLWVDGPNARHRQSFDGFTSSFAFADPEPALVV
jgi:hypothetical protein